MTKAEFNILLTDSSNLALKLANEFISDNLPNDFKYTVILNSSLDDPSLIGFEMFPGDNNKIVKHIFQNEVVDILCRNDKVPVWIDISVESIHEGKTVLQLLCAGRYSADTNELYYFTRGTGPFGIKSPIFPPSYKDDGTKFSLK